MHHHRLSALTALLALCCAVVAGALAPRSALAVTSIVYVNAAVAGGANNGTSWANAYTSLQTAFTNANPATGDTVEIWVAAGRYIPGPAGNRAATFQLKDRVAIYGGFAGGETQRDQRDWTANLVTLSGDLNGDDGPNFANNSENSYHVVTGATGAILNGVTISGGNAQSGSLNGGGMYNDTSSPTLTNVTFSGNFGGFGGGMYNLNSSPTLTNVTFSGNSTNFVGGGMLNLNSSPTLTNVTFSGNTATDGGGGMSNYNSSPTLTNVTFSGNSATNAGGGMTNLDISNPTLTNVTFSGNSATDGGGIWTIDTSSPTLTNVTFSGNSATNAGGGMYNDTSSPTLTNVTFSGNSASFAGGAMYNASGSNPQIRNSIVWGNSFGTIDNVGGSNPTVSFSLVEGGYAGTGNLASDPLFVTPIDPATAPTTAGNLRLRAASPAISAGNNSFLPAGVTADLDGNPRIVGGTVDMGAYEYQFPSVISIVRADANPSSAASVAFTVMFDRAVSGVDATDFTLAATGVTGASITSVAGSGATWTVVVNTGSGNGTLGLNLVDNDSIRDATDAPLGNVGNGNGNFTGQEYTVQRMFTVMLPLVVR